MTIILSVILAVVGYFILMLLATNLLGFVVRGFYPNPELEKMKKDEELSSAVKSEIKKQQGANVGVTIFFILLSFVIFYLLYRYLNIWAVVAVLLLMIGRIPDLSWEIKSGQKTTKENMQKGSIYTIASIICWLALPVLWWAFYTLLV
jgi:hypothetical protein